MAKIIKSINIKNEISQCLISAKNKNRKCFFCDEDAIMSHVIWKAGILKPISTNSHLIELNIQNRVRHENINFIKSGLKKILSFKGFCNYHDNNIFSKVETKNVNFTERINQILISIRGLYFEIRKKEITIDFFKSQIEKNIIPQQNYFLQNRIKRISHAINDLHYFIKNLNQEVLYPEKHYNFIYKEVCPIEVVTSSLFTTEGINTMKSMSKIKNWESIPTNSVLFTTFPYNGKSIILFGFSNEFILNKDIIKRINNYNEEELLHLVSNILIERIESWAVSFKFYEEKIKKQENRIISEFIKPAVDFTGELNKEINLFR